MIENLLFVAALAALCLAYLAWGFRHLPGERWQIFATLPVRIDADGQWQGMNFTYYGLLSAAAQLVSVIIAFLLLGAIGVSRLETVVLAVTILAACIPASKLVAVVVERKNGTLTVAGASFVGIVLAPWVIALSNVTLGTIEGSPIPVVPALAAMSVAYAFGEGLGRLACISFGCCYGKPLAAAHPLTRWLFRRWHFVFHGTMKKISYAAQLNGEKVIPIQAVTALLYVAAGLGGVLLYLSGLYAGALLLSLGVTQLWRAYSETLRADYRGGGRISVYQWLAVASVAYVAAVLWILPGAFPPVPSLAAGLATLWHPGMVLFLLALLIATFVFYGRSVVTGSRLSLYVCEDRI
jgi:hypothetical protein